MVLPAFVFDSGLKLRLQPSKTHQLSTMPSKGSWEQQAADWPRNSSSPQLSYLRQNHLWIANSPALLR